MTNANMTPNVRDDAQWFFLTDAEPDSPNKDEDGNPIIGEGLAWAFGKEGTCIDTYLDLQTAWNICFMHENGEYEDNSDMSPEFEEHAERLAEQMREHLGDAHYATLLYEGKAIDGPMFLNDETDETDDEEVEA